MILPMTIITMKTTTYYLKHVSWFLKHLCKISPFSCLTFLCSLCELLLQKLKTPYPKSASEFYPTSDCRLSAKLSPTFADRGCRLVSSTDPYGRILDFLDRRRYFLFQVAPVPDPLLLGKSDLWICSQELWPPDHRISKIIKKEKLSPLSRNKCVITCFLYRATAYLSDQWVMMIVQEWWHFDKQKKSRNATCFRTAWLTTNPLTLCRKALNPGFRGAKPTSDYLNYGTPSKMDDLSFVCTSLCKLQIRVTAHLLEMLNCCQEKKRFFDSWTKHIDLRVYCW
jgi:hypothetical protein